MANNKTVLGGSTYRINSSDNFINCYCTAAITLYLPSVSVVGGSYSVSINDVNETSATNNITINVTDSNDRINGATSFVMASNGSSLLITVTGNNDFVASGTANGGGGGISGSGTIGKFAMWTGANAVGDASYVPTNEATILAAQSGVVAQLNTKYIVEFTGSGTYNLMSLASTTLNLVRLFAGVGATITVVPNATDLINDVNANISVLPNTMVTLRKFATGWRSGD
jgi:hypothetical protein